MAMMNSTGTLQTFSLYSALEQHHRSSISSSSLFSSLIMSSILRIVIAASVANCSSFTSLLLANWLSTFPGSVMQELAWT